VTFTHDRAEALRGRRAVYVKSWGPLDGAGPTPAALRPGWTLGERDLHATDHAKVMHCLPVRRNVVISSEILDGPRSIVTEQAGNRLWAQAALVEHLARQQGVIRG
jgi:N-succinyl-L-ornithine transcarbamylase